MKIHFHGVGASLNQTMDNTYFLIEDGENRLQVDCSGGLGLAQKTGRGEIFYKDLFITHKHTDHFLGLFNLLRVIRSGVLKTLNIYCNKDVEVSAKGIVKILGGSLNKILHDEEKVKFINIEENNNINIGEFNIESFDLYSDKISQHGFLLTYNNKKILFFGNEAVGVMNRNDLDRFRGVDYLICEALNPESMSVENGGRVDNKRIFHATAMEAGIIANELNVKNLILVHTLEDIPGDRQSVLKDEAGIIFKGNIIVPDGGDILELT